MSHMCQWQKTKLGDRVGSLLKNLLITMTLKRDPSVGDLKKEAHRERPRDMCLSWPWL